MAQETTKNIILEAKVQTTIQPFTSADEPTSQANMISTSSAAPTYQAVHIVKPGISGTNALSQKFPTKTYFFGLADVLNSNNIHGTNHPIKTVPFKTQNFPTETHSSGSVSPENSDIDFDKGLTRFESEVSQNPFPKPVYSYSCLIALALKNSKTGILPVNEIYNFMTKNFPYFKSAPDGWKNSVRHNLTMNKYFEKIEKPGANGQKTRKGSLWSLNPQKLGKMEEEIIKWRKKDLQGVLKSMSHPEKLETIEQGNITSTNYMQFSHF